MTQPVLDIQQLHLSFPGFNGDVHALNNVSLQINRGEIVGLVGESGSGKSVTAMLIMRLLPTGSYCVHRGQISLLGDDVLNAREKQLRQWRGARVAMIFQEPMTALNPTRRIGLQMMDVIRHHQPISRREARAKAIALLEEMQIPDAVEVMSRYPFELSGGMRQRVMIALAFSCEPQLIIECAPAKLPNLASLCWLGWLVMPFLASILPLWALVRSPLPANVLSVADGRWKILILLKPTRLSQRRRWPLATN